jgi:hypothetical protein
MKTLCIAVALLALAAIFAKPISGAIWWVFW